MEDNKYILSKNAIGIILIWLGPPLFYFFRSQFHLGGGSITSGIFYLLSLYLLRNELNSQIGYKPNSLLLIFGGSFYLLALLYFIVFNANMTNKVTDAINIGTTIIFFLLVIRVENKVQKYLPFWIMIITLVLNLALIYSVIINPNYIIGQRATIQFGEGDFTGNPGIYARNGLFGLIISILFLSKNEDNLYLQKSNSASFIAIINIILSLVTIIITQTRMILLSLIVISFIYLIFVKKNKKEIKVKSKKSNHLLKGLLAIILLYLNNKYSIISILTSYFNNYWSMFQKALTTGLTLGKKSNTEIDDSAMGRVRSINDFQDILSNEKFNLIFGKGFNYKYLDIPILEVLINFGILGLLLFFIFISFTFVFSFKSLKSESVFQLFLGLTFFQVFIGFFTAGRPMDLAYCIIYFVYIRFISVNNGNDFKQMV